MSESGGLARWPGGQELVEWFGFEPRFHEGLIVGYGIDFKSAGWITIRQDVLRNETDENGVFTVDRSAEVTLLFEEIAKVALVPNGAGETIVSSLQAERTKTGVRVEWASSVGFGGVVFAKSLSFSFKAVATA